MESEFTSGQRALAVLTSAPAGGAEDPEGDVPDVALGPGAAALREGRGVLLARSNWHVHSLGRREFFVDTQAASLPQLRLPRAVDLPTQYCYILRSDEHAQ